MRNLLDDLQEADLDFSDVVSSTVYLREVKDADQVNSFDMKTATDEQISRIAVRQPQR